MSRPPYSARFRQRAARHAWHALGSALCVLLCGCHAYLAWADGFTLGHVILLCGVIIFGCVTCACIKAAVYWRCIAREWERDELFHTRHRTHPLSP